MGEGKLILTYVNDPFFSHCCKREFAVVKKYLNVRSDIGEAWDKFEVQSELQVFLFAASNP